MKMSAPNQDRIREHLMAFVAVDDDLADLGPETVSAPQSPIKPVAPVEKKVVVSPPKAQ